MASVPGMSVSPRCVVQGCTSPCSVGFSNGLGFCVFHWELSKKPVTKGV